MLKAIQGNHLNICLIQAAFELMEEHATVILDPFTQLIKTFEQRNFVFVLWRGNFLLEIESILL